MGISYEGELERAHLPVDLFERHAHDSVISALSMLEFAERAAANAGIGDLGYWAGLVPLAGYGSFGERVADCPTLHTAVETFCSTVRFECSEAAYFLATGRSGMWFCHGRDGRNTLLAQHELYALMIMMQVIRLALGPQWKPERICLQLPDGSGIADNEFLTSMNVEFGAGVTGIKLETRDLARSLPDKRQKAAASCANGSNSEFSALPTDPLAALRILVTSLLKQSKTPTLELAAESAGVSTRTLQRYLNTKTITFTGLLDQVRLDTALHLFEDQAISITDIAYAVGYSDVAHFSRAFSRITGMSPRHYRNLMKD
jgi:AraC-like DNA-binding protein